MKRKYKAIDYYDVLWRIKGLNFCSGGKQNQAKKGVKRLFEQGSLYSLHWNTGLQF